MRLKHEEEKNPQPAYQCVIDARKRNKENENIFNQETYDLADRVFKMASGAYTDSRVYLNNRQKFISVKVDRPSRENRLSELAEKLDKFCQQKGILVDAEPRSRIYRIYPQ